MRRISLSEAQANVLENYTKERRDYYHGRVEACNRTLANPPSYYTAEDIERVRARLKLVEQRRLFYNELVARFV